MRKVPHYDTFVSDSIPSAGQLPEFLPVPGKVYASRLNVCAELVDRWLKPGLAERPALHGATETWSYGELHDKVARYAAVLTEDLGVVPGNRIVLRGFNGLKLAALHLAVLRIGAVIVSTMPMLRAAELQTVAEKSEATHFICEDVLMNELIKAWCRCPSILNVLVYSADGDDSSIDACFDIDKLAERKSASTPVYRAHPDDPCLIAFTSGTTGSPKGAVHTHRDLLAICDTFAKHILDPKPSDVFCGSPPLAFTFGLGALLLFPLRFGASSVLLGDMRPMNLLDAIERFQATLCFTAPTAYRAMLDDNPAKKLRSIRHCISAGETLPKDTFCQFFEKTGISLIDGIGSTEMLHIFISAKEAEIRPGATGKVVPGYEAKVLDADGNEVPAGTIGWLAVKGPTGCRYLADKRQSEYVRRGWNFTGDAYYQDDDGYFWYQGRMDDMIISAGYNICPAEVESVLNNYPDIKESAVVGVSCSQRGQLIKAYIVLNSSCNNSEHDLIESIRDYTKKQIAPYKCPKQIEFVPDLPRTLTGKLRRCALRMDRAA